jgi:hypothetical protein
MTTRPVNCPRLNRAPSSPHSLHSGRSTRDNADLINVLQTLYTGSIPVAASTSFCRSRPVTRRVLASLPSARDTRRTQTMRPRRSTVTYIPSHGELVATTPSSRRARCGGTRRNERPCSNAWGFVAARRLGRVLSTGSSCRCPAVRWSCSPSSIRLRSRRVRRCGRCRQRWT